jgi:hypothetical protein
MGAKTGRREGGGSRLVYFSVGPGIVVAVDLDVDGGHAVEEVTKVRDLYVSKGLLYAGASVLYLKLLDKPGSPKILNGQSCRFGVRGIGLGLWWRLSRYSNARGLGTLMVTLRF